jgi:D-3-phosphoglycerate dehydrogenase
MVDALFLKKCDKNPIILNTSRGAVVDTKAIVEALYQNQIKGLGIDVYEDEPIFLAQIQEKELYEKLIQLDNVIATPHIAGWTVESKYKLVKILFEKLIPIIQEKS